MDHSLCTVSCVLPAANAVILTDHSVHNALSHAISVSTDLQTPFTTYSREPYPATCAVIHTDHSVYTVSCILLAACPVIHKDHSVHNVLIHASNLPSESHRSFSTQSLAPCQQLAQWFTRIIQFFAASWVLPAACTVIHKDHSVYKVLSLASILPSYYRRSFSVCWVLNLASNMYGDLPGSFSLDNPSHHARITGFTQSLVSCQQLVLGFTRNIWFTQSLLSCQQLVQWFTRIIRCSLSWVMAAGCTVSHTDQSGHVFSLPVSLSSGSHRSFSARYVESCHQCPHSFTLIIQNTI